MSGFINWTGSDKTNFNVKDIRCLMTVHAKVGSVIVIGSRVARHMRLKSGWGVYEMGKNGKWKFLRRRLVS